MPSFRVLVVEDFEPLREVVCSTLRKKPELQIVGEACDGLDAVQKAEALQPDLILLDIGLPSLNGIEAARRITKISPKSKILFVSQESSAVVAQEALRWGAGYVVKERAAGELLAAVDAVVQGGRFLSSGLVGLIDGAQAHDLCPQDALPSTPRESKVPRNHEVQFYSDDSSFVASFTGLIESALEAGSAVIVVVTESHRKSLLQSLQAHGVDLAAAIEQRSLILLDVAEALSKYMEAEGPNRERFLSAFEPLIRDAEMGQELVVLGEGVGILCAQGRVKAAIEVERLWNELAQTHAFHVHCAYPVMEELKGEPHALICAEHSAVV
jgi:DNA-binding NarL/FixJ family response regulator